MIPRRVLAAVFSFSFLLALDAHDGRAQNVPAVSVDLDAGGGSTCAT